MNQLKAIWSDVQSWFGNLSTRERRLVLATGGAVLAFVLFITLMTLSTTGSRTVRHTSDKMAKLHDVQTLALSFRESEAQRQAVELHYLRGWTLPAVAEHLGRSRTAVAGLLQRGLIALRATLGTSSEGSA